MNPNNLVPADHAAQVLDLVARAEMAEAALDLAEDDLRYTRAVRDTALKQRDDLTKKLEAVLDFHTTWGDVDDADTDLDIQALWEDLGRILGVEL